MPKEIVKLVLTGGPCAGKTKILDSISGYLKDLGYKIIIINEVATRIILSGFNRKEDNLDIVVFERAIFEEQLNLEEIYLRFLQECPYEKVIILCDRGLMDIQSFIGEKAFRGIYSAFNMTEEGILKRYHTVIHLESLAVNYPARYNLSSNKARISTVEEAKNEDIDTVEAWKNHKDFIVVKACKTFEEKKEKVLAILENRFGKK